MPASLFIARRYLRSRRHRGFVSFITVIAIVGVALGVAALIITLSILNGFETTIKENVVSFTAHMQLIGFSNLPLKDPGFALKRMEERFPQVRHAAPFVSREAMVRSDAGIEGVVLKGVDPATDISAARTRIVEGSYDLEAREGRGGGIIIGRSLAQMLEIGVGGRLLVFGLGGASLSLSETRIMQFVVTGIYETGMAEYDMSYAYVHILSAQRLFQMGKAVSGIDLLVTETDSLQTLVEEIPADLGYPYYARSMHQMYRNLFAWIELQKQPIPLIIALIVIVASVNVLGTLIMMVMEKTKDIGVLKTLGADGPTIQKVFLSQGILIGALGTVLGNVLGFGLAWLELNYQLISLPSTVYFMSHVPIRFETLDFLQVSTAAFALSVIASYLPARLATQLDPVRLLRFS